MTERHECPYGSEYCPKVVALESEVHDIEDDLKSDMTTLYTSIDAMKKTLYLICGILFAELGVTIL